MYAGVDLSCVREVEIFGKSYNYNLGRARDGRWSRWESVARRRDYSARNNRTTKVLMSPNLGKKLKENHVFGKFENVVRVVGLRPKHVRIWGWRARLPYAF